MALSKSSELWVIVFSRRQIPMSYLRHTHTHTHTTPHTHHPTHTQPPRTTFTGDAERDICGKFGWSVEGLMDPTKEQIRQNI